MKSANVFLFLFCTEREDDHEIKPHLKVEIEDKKS